MTLSTRSSSTVASLLERQELQRARPSDITFAWVARRRRRTRVATADDERVVLRDRDRC